MAQKDDRREGKQERKRSRQDAAPAQNGGARKGRAGEEAGRSGKSGGQTASRRRDDSRESSHERWIGANAEPVDMNDRWAG